ncbi:MAG: GntR family transcriptional regulator [Desulfobacterales bacterium]|jgi:DNA-binding GntR family transcriptional regulator
MKNKKTAVYEKIKEGIISGALAPGLPINENDFARDLDVSKTPVREALRQLEREGLVENIPGRGSAVAHITFQDIREIFEVREIIECGAAKRAALMRDEKEVKAKRKELEQYSKKWTEAIDFNWGPAEDIHLFIVKRIGNQKLIDTYLGLLDHIKRIRQHFGGRFTRNRFNKMVAEHLEILDAIIEGNGERAELAVQNHLHTAAAYLLGLSSPKRG